MVIMCIHFTYNFSKNEWIWLCGKFLYRQMSLFDHCHIYSKSLRNIQFYDLIDKETTIFLLNLIPKLFVLMKIIVDSGV